MHHAFGGGLGAQVVRGALVAGVQSTHVQQSRYVRFATGSDHGAGEVHMSALKAAAVAARFIQDADEVDDDVLPGHRGAQERAVVGVARPSLQARQHRQAWW